MRLGAQAPWIITSGGSDEGDRTSTHGPNAQTTRGTSTSLRLVSQGLGGRAARGAAVTLAAQVLRMVIQLTGVVVLSRLLDARDYGLVAMVLTVVTFGEIFRDFGLSSAAIQAPSLSRQERDNLFWINSAIGVVLAGLMFVAAPLLSLVYGQPALTPVAQLLALCFVFNGMTTQYRANLVRDLRFRAVATSEVASAALGLVVAVVCAAAGMGLWSLVTQQLVAAGALLFGMAIAGRWLPRWYTRGVQVRRFIRFGGHLLASQVIGYAANNVDTWTIGIRFGPTMLGFYNRAFQLLMTPIGQVRSPSTTVALPVLSRVSEDQPSFEKFVRNGQLALALPIGVAMGLAAGGAHAIVPVVLGPNWSEVAPFLQLFAIAALFQTLAYVGYWIYLARALTHVLFRYSIVAAAIKVAAIVVGSHWGALGVAVGYAVAPMLEWPVSLWWLGRHTAIPQRALYGNAFRVMTQATVVGLASLAVTTWTGSLPTAVSMLCGASAGLAVFALLAATVPPFRRDIVAVRGMARLVRRRTPHVL